jgi:peptide/nickel transport system substrate-binding protein
MRTWAKLAGVASASLFLLAACGSTSSASTSSSSGTRIKGGVAYFAEQPDSPPTYIFPFLSGATESNVNLYEFQLLMYRNLYFFGKNGKAEINYNLSLAYPPVYSNGDKTVTIHLKGWKWSNGETVDARDLVFWMNLLEANKSNWYDYVPGYFPDNVVSYKATGPLTFVLQLNKAYNPTWFTYNELSQLIPLPLAWDKTSASAPTPSATDPNAPDLTPSGARAVYNFLNAQSQDLSTYATNPLWQVVDGPWRLASFTTLGKAVFVPNPKYSGPVKPTLSEFVELPFTSDSSEFNELLTGNAITYGYLPISDLPQKARVSALGYDFSPWQIFGFNYMPLNYNNPVYGPIFKQLYIRQALQELVDQKQWVAHFLHGYGSPTYSPVPTVPPNPFDDAVSRTPQYPYSIANAKYLLTSHGWKVTAGQPATCVKPGSGAGECGAGIKAGQQLVIDLKYLSGLQTVTEEMTAFQSAAKQAGIIINLSTAPFASVISDTSACTPSQASCSWQMGNWGGGWSYSPDYYPSGETLFAAGAASNDGSFSSSQANALIAATLTGSGSTSQQTLDAYQNFMAKDLPVIYQPETDVQLSEIKSNLHGALPQSPYEYITPEDWYFTKS